MLFGWMCTVMFLLNLEWVFPRSTFTDISFPRHKKTYYAVFVVTTQKKRRKKYIYLFEYPTYTEMRSICLPDSINENDRKKYFVR